MADLASSMTGMLLPNHFQPLDHDSESDDESTEYGNNVQIPFSSMSTTTDPSPRPRVKSTSPNVTVEYLPHVDLKNRTDESWNPMDSSVITNDSGFTPNSSGFSADLSSSGGFSSSCDLSFNSNNSSISCSESFRTQQLNVQSFENHMGLEQPVTPTKLSDTNTVQTDDPLTPTANLKMLLSAMSPEIRNMENKKKKARLFDAMVEAASQGTVSSTDQRTVSPTEQGVLSPTDQGTISPIDHGIVSPNSQETVSSQNHTSSVNSSSGHDTSFLMSSQDDNGGEEGEKNNRKAKSLGLLCQKFLTKYPDYPKDGKAMDISLDQISKDLNVERRRIYDIVNVLESVEMVSRRAKNRYLWHGRTHINRTLAKLKCLGQRQRFAEQLALLQSRLDDGSLSMDESKSPVYGPDRIMGEVTKQPLQDISNYLRSPLESEMRKDGKETWEDDTKRDKTLGVMSQKFIMLFLVCKDRIISLDVAARILKGDQNYQIGENAKFKTKVRRLYDIANILTSLKLIDKIHLSDGRSRKPAFRWIGPDPDTSHVDWSELPTGSKPTQKHSYFPLPPVNSDSWSSNPNHKQTPAMVKLPLGKVTPIKSRINWSRNASFSAICEVAEQECRKYSSAPNSPVKREEEEEEEKENGKNKSPSVLASGSKKEEEFIQEFQALRNKYPACVSRLFSGSAMTSSDPSPLTPDPSPLTPDPLHHQLSPREAPQVTKVEVASPRGTGEETNSASKTKPQKVVYVQRFVPLLNASTIAAVQASTTPQTDPSNPTIMTGNRTIVSPSSSALMGGQHPAVMSPTPGSVIHLLPMRQENWVQLPHGNEVVTRNAINVAQKGTASSGVQLDSRDPQTKSVQVPTSSQVVTIIRRSKRAVKLALDKEFEYHPMVKKVKGGERTTEANSQNPSADVAVSEPVKNSTVIITHPTPLVTMPKGPHPKTPQNSTAPCPQPNSSQVETGHDAKITHRSIVQETPLVRNNTNSRRASLKHVKRRLTVDLDKEPSEATDQAPRPADKNSRNASKKMPRCFSLSALDSRKCSGSPVIVPYIEMSSEMHSRAREQIYVLSPTSNETKQSNAVNVSSEYNYSSYSVKMKFGGKFGSLKRNVEDMKADIGKTSEEAEKSVDRKDTNKSSNAGQKFENAEQKLLEMDKRVKFEDCWLSASFPPPSLSGFSTFLQGRSSRGTPHLASSRPSSVVSIGELDQWLFPTDNASPSVSSGQKTVSTPWVLTPTISSTYSSPPKLTTQASPAGHNVALASPRPVLPQTIHSFCLSPQRSLADASAESCPEPLYTSTPKSPKPSTASIKYFNSDPVDSQSGMESVSYSEDDTPPCQLILRPHGWQEDLGKLKPLEGIPLEEESVTPMISQGTLQKQPGTEYSCSKIISSRKSTHKSAPGVELGPSIVSTSSSQTSNLPPYLMRSAATASSRAQTTSQLPLPPLLIGPTDICSSRHGMMKKPELGSTAVTRLSNMQRDDFTKDITSTSSSHFIHHTPMLQTEMASSSREVNGAPPPPSKPFPCLQNLSYFPQIKSAICSGLDTGLSKVWKLPSRYKVQHGIPQAQVKCTVSGTTYTVHDRPCTGNASPAEASDAGKGAALDSIPTAFASTWNSWHKEAMSHPRGSVGRPYPLQITPGPATGCAPRFTAQTNPTPDTKVMGPSSMSWGIRVNGVFPQEVSCNPSLVTRSNPTPNTKYTGPNSVRWGPHMNGVNAHEACSRSNAEVSSKVHQHLPWSLPSQVVQGVSLSSDSVPPTGQTNCNHYVTSG